MSAEPDGELRARAIEWHIRLRDGDDAIWEAFADWLAKDERHAAAYDAVERADHAIEPLLQHLVLETAANDVAPASAAPPTRTRRWGLVGGAVAASVLAVAVALPQLLPSRYEVVTGPGERQVVELDAATRITLNGATRMTFDRRNPRFAALAAGEALFQVRHDARAPFRLKVGGKVVEDAGTVFNVVHEVGETRVAVAEGKVIYDARRDAVPLQPGQLLVDRDGTGAVHVTGVPTATVGAWTKGSLVYSGAPLAQVAADLGRAVGVKIVVAPALAGRPFFGTIQLDGSGPDQFRRLEPALNVSLTQTADGWIMEPVRSAGK